VTDREQTQAGVETRLWVVGRPFYHPTEIHRDNQEMVMLSVKNGKAVRVDVGTLAGMFPFLNFFFAPMSANGDEPVSSRGLS
jgi:hypothetical protein